MNLHFCVFYTHLGDIALKKSNYLINVSQVRGHFGSSINISYNLIFAAERNINPIGDGKIIADIVDFDYIVQLINNYYSGEEDLLKNINLPSDHKGVCDDINELYMNKKLDADCVCFSCYRPFMFALIYAAIIIRKNNPNIDIIVGGPFIELSVKGREVFSALDIFDYVVKGDIEIVLEKYLNNDLSKDEHIVEYGSMKELSVPIYLLPEIITKPNLYFSFSRGCPFLCSYCPGSHRRIKALPLDTVIETYKHYNKLLSRLKNLKKDVGMFVTDNTFNFSKKRINDICDGLIEINNELRSEAFFTIDNLDNDILRKLKAARFDRVKIGIDTYNEEKSALYNNESKYTKENIYPILDETVKLGLEIFGKPGLYGMPGETAEMFEEEWKFLCELTSRYQDSKGFYFMPHMFYFISGTDVYNRPSNFGVTYENWGDMNCVIPEINEIAKNTPRYYYSNVSTEEYFRRYKKLKSIHPTFISYDLENCMELYEG